MIYRTGCPKIPFVIITQVFLTVHFHSWYFCIYFNTKFSADFPVFLCFIPHDTAGASSIFHKSKVPADSNYNLRRFLQIFVDPDTFLRESAVPGTYKFHVPANTAPDRLFCLFLQFDFRCCRTYFFLSDLDSFDRFHPAHTRQTKAYPDFLSTAGPFFPFPHKIRCCSPFPQKAWYTAHDAP